MRSSALGFVLLIRAANVVNFAQGEFSMLGAYLMVILANDIGVPYFISIPIVLVLMCGFGVLCSPAPSSGRCAIAVSCR